MLEDPSSELLPPLFCRYGPGMRGRYVNRTLVENKKHVPEVLQDFFSASTKQKTEQETQPYPSRLPFRPKSISLPAHFSYCWTDYSHLSLCGFLTGEDKYRNRFFHRPPQSSRSRSHCILVVSRISPFNRNAFNFFRNFRRLNKCVGIAKTT